MGMSKISLQDKETIVNRLAQGESYSQAIEGTEIKSKDTVHRIAKQETNAIERKRQQFLKKIKKSGASDSRRAEMWSRMLYATKLVGKDIIEQPDWQARATALKYIDSLDDLNKAEEMKLDFKDNTPQPMSEISEQEQTDFNEAFKRFLEQEE